MLYVVIVLVMCFLMYVKLRSVLLLAMNTMLLPYQESTISLSKTVVATAKMKMTLLSLIIIMW